jgi:hypothetical protein
MEEVKREDKPIPDGYYTVTPYLVVYDVAGMIDFLQVVF